METTPPKDSPADFEANLFAGSSEKAKELYRESKRVRRLADRKSWWLNRGKEPSATETQRTPNSFEG
jgi:hypothetical protein